MKRDVITIGYAPQTLDRLSGPANHARRLRPGLDSDAIEDGSFDFFTLPFRDAEVLERCHMLNHYGPSRSISISILADIGPSAHSSGLPGSCLANSAVTGAANFIRLEPRAILRTFV